MTDWPLLIPQLAEIVLYNNAVGFFIQTFGFEDFEYLDELADEIIHGHHPGIIAYLFSFCMQSHCFLILIAGRNGYFPVVRKVNGRVLRKS